MAGLSQAAAGIGWPVAVLGVFALVVLWWAIWWLVRDLDRRRWLHKFVLDVLRAWRGDRHPPPPD
jgi:hypothetical protein